MDPVSDHVLIFDGTKELLILTPETLRKADDEALMELLEWIEELQQETQKPRTCLHCGARA